MTINSKVRTNRMIKQELRCNLFFYSFVSLRFFQLISLGCAAQAKFKIFPLYINSLLFFQQASKKKFLQCWYWKDTKACPTKWVRLNKKESSSANCLLRTNLQSLINSIRCGIVEKRSQDILYLSCSISWVFSYYSFLCSSMSLEIESSMISNLLRLQQRDMDLTMSLDFSSPQLDFISYRKSFQFEFLSVGHWSLCYTHRLIFYYKYASRCFLQKNSVFLPFTSLFLGKSRIGILLMSTAQESQLIFLVLIKRCHAFFWQRQIARKMIDVPNPPKNRQFMMLRSSACSLARLFAVCLQIQSQRSGMMSLIWQEDYPQTTYPKIAEKMKQRKSAAFRKEKQTATPDGNLNYQQFQVTSIDPEVVEQQIGMFQLSILIQQHGQTTGI